MLIWRRPSISQTVMSKFPGVLMKCSYNQIETDNDKPHALAVRVQHSVIALPILCSVSFTIIVHSV